jgi:hypothetical protein
MFDTAGNIKVFNMMMPVDEVTFDQNPKSFQVRKGTNSSSRPQTGSGGQTGVPSPTGTPAGYTNMYRGTLPTQVTFTALLSDDSGGGVGDAVEQASVVGGGIKARCDLLLQWTQPGGGGSLAGAALGAAASALGFKFQSTARPTLLTMQWGDPARGFLMQGYLKNVSIDYKRFDSAGNPIRAEATCTFEEAPNFLLTMLTNPTSGGVPGRRSRMVRSGESLHSIATATYERPQAWRAIAEANGIDDPFRVRPGRTVMLPPADEVF